MRDDYKVMKLITRATHCMVKACDITHLLRTISNIVYFMGYELINYLSILKIERNYYTGSL